MIGTERDPTCELGVVRSVHSGLEDHGIRTVQLGIDFDSSFQGFGGLVLDDDRLHKAYIAELCALFGVSDLKLIEGRPCWALRSLAYGTIDGLRVDDRVFTHTGFRRRHIDPNTPSALESEIASRRRSIESLRRRIAEQEAAIKHLPSIFRDWERDGGTGT